MPTSGRIADGASVEREVGFKLDAMADMQADVLVTHEAPTSHKYGFPEIDLLAEAMGCQLVVHGHVHADYEAVLPSGIRVVGVGKAKVCIPAPPSPNFLLR